MGNKALPGWGLIHSFAVVRERLLGPADRSLHGNAGVFMADWIFRALVEHHHDVAAERELDVDRGGRREFVGVAVEMRLECDAFVGDLAQTGKAEDLIAAGIGQKRAGPGHEAVKSAELADQFVAGAEKEMVGVAEDDAGLEFVPEIALVQPFDRCLCTDGHEDGRRDVAVFGVQDAGAGACDRAFGEEFKGDLAGQRLLYCACVSA